MKRIVEKFEYENFIKPLMTQNDKLSEKELIKKIEKLEKEPKGLWESVGEFLDKQDKK